MAKRSPPEPHAILRARSGAVTSVAFVNSDLLVSGHSDPRSGGSVHVWLPSTARHIASARFGGSSGVVSVAKLGDPGKFLSQDRQGRLRFWDVADGALQERAHIETFCSTMCRAAVCDHSMGGTSSSLVALPSAKIGGSADAGVDSEVEVWDVRSARVAMRTDAAQDEVNHGMCMHVSFIGRAADPKLQILRGCEDGTIGLWDATAARWLWNEKIHKDPILSIAMLGTDRGLSGSADKSIAAFEINHALAGVTVHAIVDTGHRGVGEVAVRCDHKIFAAACWDHRVRVYNLKSLAPLAILRSHKDSVNTLAFAELIGLLASGSKDSTIALWKIYP